MKEQYALITGAGKGIGRAIAEYCASLGMNVALISLPHENLEELSYRIARLYKVKSLFLEIDLSQPDTPKKLLQWCVYQQLEVNILVNNAGIGYEGNFEDYTPSFYEGLLKVNVLAPALITREFLPLLKRQREAWILNISSFAGFYPMPFKVVYAASKSFITRFSEALRQELKGSNVSISVLCPAGVDSYPESSTRIEQMGWIAKTGRFSPWQIATIAVKGMLKKKSKIIPGKINVFLYYLSRLLPTRFQAWIIHLVLCRFYRREKEMEIRTEANKREVITHDHNAR